MEFPHRQRERHRLDVLRRYPTLESLPDGSFGTVVELTRRIFGATAALVHVPALDRIFHSSSTELDQVALATLCDLPEATDSAARILIHEHLDRNPRFQSHSLVAGKPGFRFLAAVPLRAPDGLTVGTLCVLDAAARSFSNAECEMLLGIADNAMLELDLRRQAGEAARLLRDHPHPVWMYDVESLRVVAANEAASQFYGLAREALLDQTVADLLDGEDAAAIVEGHGRGSGLERLPNAGHRHAGGQTRRVDTLLTSSYFEGRRVRAVEVLASAQQHQIEDEARQAETFYRRVLDELPARVSVLDTDGRILFVSGSGVQDPEMRAWLIGKTAAEYHRRLGLPPAIAERRQRYLEAAVRERRSIEFEEEIPSSDGPPRHYIRILKPVIRTDGSVKYLTSCAVDVTERKRLEGDVRESEQRFRALIRNVPFGIMLLDPRGRVMEFNPALLETTGYAADEVFEQPNFLARIAHPEEATRITRLLEEVSAGRTESGQLETRIVRKDGSPSWIDLSISLVRDQKHRPGSLMVVLEDVTERREAELELMKSEKRHSVLIEEAPDGMLIGRFRGPLIEVNLRACEMTGYTREEMLRLRPEDLIRNGSLEKEPEIWEQLAGGEVLELERRIIRKDGKALPVDISMRLIDDRMVLIMMRDASSRFERASQLEFQANALSQISEAVVATDILGVLTYLNTSAERLLGINAAEAVGRHTSEVIHARLVGSQQIGEIAEILFREGHWRGEVVVDVPENQRLYTEVSVRLARDRNNLPIGTLTVARDITERKEYERNLIAAKDEAEEMNRLKTAFLANMSHEIRTPLTSIIGFAEVLSEEAAENEREFASLIRNSGRRLMETLNSVLDLAQLESEALKLDPVPIDVMEPVRDTLELFKAQAEDRGLYLEAEADQPGPVTARLDRVGLSRILINLVSNAVKFTHQGGVRIYVRTEENHVHITVKDTGVGISREFLPHLFDEFKQESSGLSRNYEGSGLGLTITKRLVELMDGAIDVESEKGKGTVFVVTFPR
ncbi:MAG TPA: PAS domain S-box protein [Rhodothermales bacterium]